MPDTRNKRILGMYRYMQRPFAFERSYFDSLKAQSLFNNHNVNTRLAHRVVGLELDLVGHAAARGLVDNTNASRLEWELILHHALLPLSLVGHNLVAARDNDQLASAQPATNAGARSIAGEELTLLGKCGTRRHKGVRCVTLGEVDAVLALLPDIMAWMAVPL